MLVSGPAAVDYMYLADAGCDDVSEVTEVGCRVVGVPVTVQGPQE